jgi:hypothetical protein
MLGAIAPIKARIPFKLCEMAVHWAEPVWYHAAAWVGDGKQNNYIQFNASALIAGVIASLG